MRISIHKTTFLGKKVIKQFIILLNRILGNYKEQIFILGDGRSGTTWLSDILNPGDRYRTIFEPFDGCNFSPPLENKTAFFNPAHQRSDRLAKQFKRVKNGSYITNMVSYKIPKLFYKGLLIKDVNSHLILDEIHREFSNMKKILIIRHPFAVSESKLKKYTWPTKPSFFLETGGKVDSFTSNQRKLIEELEKKNDPKLLKVVFWCILHRLAFSANSIREYHIVFYEFLVTNPDQIVKQMYSALGQEVYFNENKTQIERNFNSKSFTTHTENTIQASKSGKASWKETWSPDLIEEGITILKAFDLDQIYGHDHFPKLTASELKQHLISGTLRLNQSEGASSSVKDQESQPTK